MAVSIDNLLLVRYLRNIVLNHTCEYSIAFRPDKNRRFLKRLIEKTEEKNCT